MAEDGGRVAQNAWIRRVLGIDVAASATGKDLAGWMEACDLLEAASAVVSEQIGALQRALADFDDDEDIRALGASTEFGLNGITGGKRVPLQAALLQVRGKNGAELAAGLPMVVSAAQALRDHLDSDGQVEACEDNPFGVTVTIRATMDPALSRLQEASSALIV